MTRYTEQDVIEIFETYSQVRAAECEARFYEFFKDAWRIIEPGTELVDNWHIEYICDQLQEISERIREGGHKEHDQIINVPPSTSKSSMVTVAWNAWDWIANPKSRWITGSYSATLSIDHALKTRDIIQSDWYQRNWGDRFQLRTDKKRKSEFGNTEGGWRFATGVRGTVTGKHADFLILDDPISPQQADSDSDREAANRWVDKTIGSRLRDQLVSTTVFVMQRLHQDDPTGHVEKRDGISYRKICLPAEESDKVHPPVLRRRYKDGLLDPVRLPRSVLKRKKSQLGTIGHAGQYQQSPKAEDGNYINPAWFGSYSMALLKARAALAKQELVWNFTIDPAFTAKEENDPTAILAWAYFENCLYVRDCAQVWLELPDLVPFIGEFAMRNGYTRKSRVFIEPKASGLSAAQTAKRQLGLNAVVDVAPTDDKLARVRACLPFLEGGRCYLLEYAPFVGDFKEECGTFPNASHDDRVDTLTAAINRVDNPASRVQAYSGRRKSRVR